MVDPATHALELSRLKDEFVEEGLEYTEEYLKEKGFFTCVIAAAWWWNRSPEQRKIYAAMKALTELQRNEEAVD